jgi:hypothetical protein
METSFAEAGQNIRVHYQAFNQESVKRRTAFEGASRWAYDGAVTADLPLRFDAAALESLCRSHHVRRLSAFGSVLRSDFSPASDVDLLVEFQPGRTPGLAFFRLEEELSELFGRRVDLNTQASLSPYFRDRVLYAARDLYVAA